MKVLDSRKKNFDKLLDNLLIQRKRKVQSSSVSVTNIIKDVKKNGDKALLKYEKKFNKNIYVKIEKHKSLTNFFHLHSPEVYTLYLTIVLQFCLTVF